MTDKNLDITQALLHYKEDSLNLARGVTALPIVLLPLVTGLPASEWAIVYALLIWFLLSDINFLLHQHVHHPISRSRFLNGLLDIFMGLATGMSASAWRQHHLFRHHKGDNAWTYARDWEKRRPTFLGCFIYSFRYAAIVFFAPLWESFHKGIITRKRHPHKYRAAFIDNFMVFAFVAFLVVSLPLFYIPYFFMVTYYTTRTDYENHVGCDQDSAYGFANNVLSPLYNVVRDNFGYHTAHHYFPEAHWTTLPRLHATLADKIPPKCIRDCSGTGLWTPPLVLNMIFK